MRVGSVRVICGSNASDRAQRLDALFCASLGRAVLIVPTESYAVLRAERLVRGSDIPGLLGAPVLSFGRFVSDLLEAEGISAEPVGDLDRDLLMRRAAGVLRNEDGPGVWRDVMDTPGFRTHLRRVIEGLKQAAVDPEGFKERVENRRHRSPVDDAVGRAYEEYQRLLRAQGLFDRIGLFWMAAEQCAQGRPRYLDSIERLLLDGFDDFTPSERRLIERLAPIVGEMVIGLNYDSDPAKQDLYRVQARALGELVARFKVQPEVLESPSPQTHSEYAAQYLLYCGEPPDLESAARNLTVVPCPYLLDEVEYVSRQVKRLLVSGAAAADDIAVVFSDLPAVAYTVLAVFSEFGIPVILDWRRPLSQTAAAAFVLLLLEVMDQWPREETAECLAAPWIPPDDETERRAMAAAPALARLSGIVSTYEDWQRGLAGVLASIEGGCGEDEFPDLLQRIPRPKETIEALARRIGRISALTDDFPAHATVAEFAEATACLIDRAGIRRAVCQHPVEAVRTLESVALAEVEDVLGRVHAWHQTTGDGPISRARFVELFGESLSAASISSRRAEGGVWITEPQRLRGLRIPYVYFCGVNEGLIPSPQPANAIYPEQDLRDLGEAGIALETERDRSDRQLLLFDQVLEAAERRLCITWRMMAPDGREMRRSPFLADLLRLFESAPVEAPRVHPDAFAPIPEDIFSTRDLRNAAVCRQPQLAQAFRAETESVLRGIAVERNRYDPVPFGVYDGVVSGAAALEGLADRFGEAHVFSAGQVETYLTCPFQFFVARVLGVEPVEDPGEKWETIERGRIVHEILCRFHSAHRRVPFHDIPAALERLGQVTAEVFAERERRISTQLRGLLRAEQLAVTRLLERYAYWEQERSDPWQPEHFEVSFGLALPTEPDPLDRSEPFPMPTSEGIVLFSGRIDRFDGSPEGVRIIDYKTGSQPTFKSICEGKSVQLPVYVLAVENHLRLSKPCLEARYIPVGRKASTRFMSRAQEQTWQQCLDQAIAAVSRVVRAIRDGRFPPTPQNNACAHCPARPACRYDETRVARKQQADTPL